MSELSAEAIEKLRAITRARLTFALNIPADDSLDLYESVICTLSTDVDQTKEMIDIIIDALVPLLKEKLRARLGK